MNVSKWKLIFKSNWFDLCRLNTWRRNAWKRLSKNTRNSFNTQFRCGWRKRPRKRCRTTKTTTMPTSMTRKTRTRKWRTPTTTRSRKRRKPKLWRKWRASGRRSTKPNRFGHANRTKSPTKTTPTFTNSCRTTGKSTWPSNTLLSKVNWSSLLWYVFVVVGVGLYM